MRDENPRAWTIPYGSGMMEDSSPTERLGLGPARCLSRLARWLMTMMHQDCRLVRQLIRLQ